MRKDRGAVLLLVLAAVTILTVVAVELSARATVDTLRASRFARDAGFRRVFDSGDAVARGILGGLHEQTNTHWGQTWTRETKTTLRHGEDLALRLADESGKLNIARVWANPGEAKSVLARLSRLFDYLSKNSRDSALDWRTLKTKVLQRMGATEPLVSLDGLREVGIDSGIIFESQGLSKYLTTFGDGSINLNTAPSPVLFALDPEFDETIVASIVAYRGADGIESRPSRQFREPADLMFVDGVVSRSMQSDGSFRVTRNLFEKVQEIVTVKSSCFSARVAASVMGRTRHSWFFFSPVGARLGSEEILP